MMTARAGTERSGRSRTRSRVTTTAMLAVASVLVAIPSIARAYPTGAQFDLDPLTQDGAGGIAFTGAPRFAGHTCAVCHTEPPGQIGLRLESNKPELFTDGWKPGQQYQLRVVMQGEHAGIQFANAGDNCGFAVDPYKACDQNGFALEIADTGGKPRGSYVPVASGACANSGSVPSDVDIRVLDDGTAITHNGAHMAMTHWDFCWTAPSAGTGTLTAYITAVDGNGGTGGEAFPTDTIGDDVAAGTVPMPELGQPGEIQTGGCDAAPGDAGLVLAFALALALALRKRRARRHLTTLATLVAIAGLAGCVHVRPRERETLAKRKMKFAPDPGEDELDLHMQESREGSSGGYGSSGGGCGCN